MSSKHLKILWPLLLMLAMSLGVWAFVAERPVRIWEHKITTAPINVSPTPIPNGTGTRTRGPVQTVRFTLYDVGIYPRQARARTGLVAIAIEDLSGGTSGVVVMKLGGEGAVRVGLVGRLQNKWRGRSEMRLEPGRYEIFDSDRPGNRAELLIEP